jgi:hypothetical protein
LKLIGSTLLFTTLLATLVFVSKANADPQHGIVRKEYEQFHEVLHPLEHEALPQKDFGRIRSKANELVRLGKAIIKVGVARGSSPAHKEFAKELKKFGKSLARFKADAKSGTDEQLRVSYSAVHDSFEILLSMGRTLYPMHPPPVVSMECPGSGPVAGSYVTVTAHSSESGKLAFVWTVSAGKIQKGDGTPTITIDTTGLAGQTILVTAEVTGGSGHTAASSCKVEIAT